MGTILSCYVSNHAVEDVLLSLQGGMGKLCNHSVLLHLKLWYSECPNNNNQEEERDEIDIISLQSSNNDTQVDELKEKDESCPVPSTRW